MVFFPVYAVSTFTNRVIHYWSKDRLNVGYSFGFLLASMPYQKNTLAKMGINAPQATRGKRLNKKPSKPFTTFTGES